MKIASKQFLIFLNLTGSLIVISSSSWFSIWVGMELSSMTMPSLILLINSSLVSKINSWKYYMVQCYSSTVFFLCILSLSFSSPLSSYSNIIWLLVVISMLFKMGILPFHGWFFHIALSLPWTLFLIMSSIQKIGPLIIISECFKVISQFTQLDLMAGCIISLISISGLKVNSIRHFMVTSSIINSAWMVASAQVSKSSFVLFMIFYFIHLVVLFVSMEKEFSNLLESCFLSFKKPFYLELMKIVVVLSMIGMPPLLGFFMKLSIVEQLIAFNQVFSAFILTMSSSIIMLMYMKMIISMISNMRVESLKQFKFNHTLSLSILFLIMSSVYFLV